MKYVVLILFAFLMLPLGCADPMQLKLSEADKLADAGKYREAITVYKEIYDTKPSAEIKSKLANTYVKRADVYFSSDNYTNAIADYNEATVYDSSLDLKKQLSAALYKRGLTFLKRENQVPILLDSDRKCEFDPTLRDQVPMAISDFTTIIELNPTNKDALNDRGYAYAVIGEYDKALPDLDKVIELDPANQMAYGNRGLAWAGKGNYDIALQDLSKAIEINKDYASTYYHYRAQVYKRYFIEYYKAVDDYSTVINMTSEKDRFWKPSVNNRALLYMEKLGQPEKAVEDLGTLIRLCPDVALYYYNRGWAYFSTRRYQESLTDFQKYLAIDVDDCYHLRLYTSGHIDGVNRILSGVVIQ